MERNSSYLSPKRGCWPISCSVSHSRPCTTRGRHPRAEGPFRTRRAVGGGGEAGAAAGAQPTAPPRRDPLGGRHPSAAALARPPPTRAPSALEGSGPSWHVRLPRGPGPLGWWWRGLRSGSCRPPRGCCPTSRLQARAPRARCRRRPQGGPGPALCGEGETPATPAGDAHTAALRPRRPGRPDLRAASRRESARRCAPRARPPAGLSRGLCEPGVPASLGRRLPLPARPWPAHPTGELSY